MGRSSVWFGGQLRYGNSRLASLDRLALDIPVRITVVVRAGLNLNSFLKQNKPDGVEIRILTRLLHRDFGQDTMSFVIVFSTGVLGNLVANWLWEKFKQQPPQKITIRQREIMWDKGELIRAIEQELQIEGKSQSQRKNQHPDD